MRGPHTYIGIAENLETALAGQEFDVNDELISVERQTEKNKIRRCRGQICSSQEPLQLQIFQETG